MPELPEVETVARYLRLSLVGREICAVTLTWARTVARPAPDAFVAALTGTRITAVNRRGKFLCFSLASGQTWLTHLRMTGAFFLSPIDEETETAPEVLRRWNPDHVRARFRLGDGQGLIFVDMRKFGRFYLVDDPQEMLGDLGPEPLGEGFTVAWLREALRDRRGEIKRLLLNQHFIAGLGNIYAGEALWRARIHPRRRAGSLTATEVRRLHEAIVASLQVALADGGTTLDDRQYRDPHGRSGDHQAALAVYDRAGERCPRCGSPIARIVQGQRSTYFCPVCQPRPPVDGNIAAP
ncbi:MAG: bifunctional DNA-formamidopyrimidine glycosylase/DNA-(apurinic or apyrimidinic site) lyase [Anaerolineae bacterium]